MAKYTTEVRHICEIAAGYLDESDYLDVDDIIEKAYPKIFKTSQIPMFTGETPEHRSLLYKKILLHYYTREIGYETPALWKLKLNQRMMEIMPYYNQLYESELLKFDPLKNVDNTRTHQGQYNDDEKVDNVRDTTENTVSDLVGESDTEENTVLRHDKTTTKGDDERTNVVNSNSDTWTLFSDTPQGGINGIANASSGSVGDNSYLTNATHVIGTPDGQTVTQKIGDVVETYNKNGDKRDTVTSHTDVHNTSTTDKVGKQTDDNTKNANGTDEYENKEMGKIGVETYSEMLNKFRDTFLNIDMMVIKDLESLFMQLW